MRWLIYSDVHGNLPAFEKMLKHETSIDSYICLGDLVNYGPWSNECVELAKTLPNSIILMGNHEEFFINGNYGGTNTLVKSFFNLTYPHFKHFEQIKEFITSFELERYQCIHTINNTYIYPDTKAALNNNYVIGHSHYQFIYQNNGYTLYNAGSVGQNRKEINKINYLIYETDSSTMSLKSLEYNIYLLINEMKRLGYPEACIHYYLDKMK